MEERHDELVAALELVRVDATDAADRARELGHDDVHQALREVVALARVLIVIEQSRGAGREHALGALRDEDPAGGPARSA